MLHIFVKSFILRPKQWDTRWDSVIALRLRRFELSVCSKTDLSVNLEQAV